MLMLTNDPGGGGGAKGYKGLGAVLEGNEREHWTYNSPSYSPHIIISFI